MFFNKSHFSLNPLSSSSSPKIILSTRAYTDILNETSQHLQTETGGVFIGAKDGGVWQVVESIDPGPRALLSHSYFEYDQGYVNHLANKVSKRYSSPLRLLGLWHRHPGGFDRFSTTDDETHLRYIQQCNGPIISVLVNIDPKFRLTCYLVDGPPIRHEPLSYSIGDDLLPSTLLRPQEAAVFMQRINSPSAVPQNTAHNLEIQDRLVSRPFFLPSHTSEEVQPSPQGSSEQVLDMLDSEMDFLENQNDFSYELEMVPSGLLLTLKPLASRATQQQLEFLFAATNETQAVIFSGKSYRFEKGIVEKLVGSRFY